MSDAEQWLIDLFLKHQKIQRQDVWCASGDDAAGFMPPQGLGIVATVDAQIEGTHFDERFSAQDIGHRALAISLSDIAAMGAQPCWALISMSLPDMQSAWIDAFSQGFCELATRYQIECIGGNISRGARAVHVVLMGAIKPEAALRQNTAQVGDVICVTGQLGAGAWALEHAPGGGAAGEAACAVWCRPDPPVRFAMACKHLINACIDISDGVLRDLQRLLQQSECGAQLDLDACPYHPVLNILQPQMASDYAWLGGEVYGLCFTVAPQKLQALMKLSAQHACQVTPIGHIIQEKGVAFIDQSKRPRPQGEGFEHFNASV